MTRNRKTKLLALCFAAAALLTPSCRRNEPARPVPRQPSADSSASHVLTGRVVTIADGDTVTVLDSTNTQYRIRLQGIDAPESRQAYGTQSKKNLSEMVFGRDVTVTWEKADQYGRLVGKILLEGRDINLEQVRAGMAWHYKEYQREQSAEDRELYAKAEDEARIERRGLWNDPDPLPPGQFRKDRKNEQRARAAASVIFTPRGVIAYSY